MELWRFGVLLAVCAGIYFLYLRCGLVTKSIRAILFVFQPGKCADRVALDSCTGWVKHAGKFRESRRYEFVLDCQLSKGDADVSLLDRKDRPLLKLDRQNPAGWVELDGKCRYYLRWSFRDATGKCELRW